MPLQGRHVQRRRSMLQRQGVSGQSGARMLHCCSYRESNTQIEEGGKNHGIRFTQPKIRTRIYVYISFVCRESSSCMQ
jgi:hypothetical protein